MIIRASAIAVIVAAFASLATPAAAVDGEILIDQAKVNAGGITPGDAPGFPATLTRPGRYKLTGNLTVPLDKNGIEVTQHDVTIDLNGFTISSSNPPPGFPPAPNGVVSITAANGLRVMNGTIMGFDAYAIYTEGRRAVAENLRLIGNGVGIIVGAESRIRTSTIANGFGGIHCQNNCLIEQNVASNNVGSGMDTGGGVIRNLIASNSSWGLFASARTGYGNNMVFRNRVGGNADFFVQLHPNICAPACP